MQALTSMNDLEMMGANIATLSSMNDVEIMGARVADLLESLNGEHHARNIHNAIRQARDGHATPGHAVQVIDAAFKSVAWLDLGFPPTSWTAADPVPTKPVTVTTARPMKPKEVLIPSTISPYFRMEAATIAGTNLLNGNSVPTENYSSGSFRGGKVQWTTINTSTPLQLSITCTDTTVARTFEGQVSGPTLLK